MSVTGRTRGQGRLPPLLRVAAVAWGMAATNLQSVNLAHLSRSRGQGPHPHLTEHSHHQRGPLGASSWASYKSWAQRAVPLASLPCSTRSYFCFRPGSLLSNPPPPHPPLQPHLAGPLPAGDAPSPPPGAGRSPWSASSPAAPSSFSAKMCAGACPGPFGRTWIGERATRGVPGAHLCPPSSQLKALDLLHQKPQSESPPYLPARWAVDPQDLQKLGTGKGPDHACCHFLSPGYTSEVGTLILFILFYLLFFFNGCTAYVNSQARG